MVLFSLRVVLTRVLFNHIAHLFGIDKPQFRAKLIENMWYCVYYPSTLAVAWYILSDADFFPWNAPHYWTNYPNYSDWESLPLHYLFYMFQLGFYFQGLYALIMFETRRKDFYELLIHHSVTILLIVMSYCAAQHRIGLNVLIIHDFSDILLYGTKVAHYLDKYSKRWPGVFLWITNVGFLVFAVAFAYSRNYIFPVFVIWPALQAGLNTTIGALYCPQNDCGMMRVQALIPNNASWTYVYDSARLHYIEVSHLGCCIAGHCLHSGIFLIGMMIILEILHVFWMAMILRMIFRSFLKGKEVCFHCLSLSFIDFVLISFLFPLPNRSSKTFAPTTRTRPSITRRRRESKAQLQFVEHEILCQIGTSVSSLFYSILSSSQKSGAAKKNPTKAARE